MSTLLNELEQFEFLGTSYEVSRIAEFIEKKIQVAVNSEKERIREDLEKSNLLVIDALETYKV
jgi:spore coat polysaccharide biosynthesis predicted glycosyltransferase SpsG